MIPRTAMYEPNHHLRHLMSLLILAMAGCGDGSKVVVPVVGTWTVIAAAGAPSERVRHTAVWTGEEMIVWGGEYAVGGVTLHGDGARYDPAVDRWTPITLDGAPIGRAGHTAVWTGQEVLVWGGTSEVAPGDFRTQSSGGGYDPTSDQWRPMSMTGAPSPRTGHLAAWTGDEMIIWGGIDDAGGLLDGGRYNPTTDSWQPIAAADLSTFAGVVGCGVWTGGELVVWSLSVTEDGTSVVPEGARFSPSSSSWSSMNQEGAPEVIACNAVWSGDEMIVTGDNGLGATGGRYRPDTDTWIGMDNDGAPPVAYERTAIWAGSLVIVWGGFSVEGDEPEALASGGLYDPASDSWSATAGAPIPPRSDHTAVWTGSEMIVWGGSGNHSYLATGGRFAPQ